MASQRTLNPVGGQGLVRTPPFPHGPPFPHLSAPQPFRAPSVSPERFEATDEQKTELMSLLQRMNSMECRDQEVTGDSRGWGRGGLAANPALPLPSRKGSGGVNITMACSHPAGSTWLKQASQVTTEMFY